jgi:uncharacterized membrane protein YgcG
MISNLMLLVVAGATIYGVYALITAIRSTQKQKFQRRRSKPTSRQRSIRMYAGKLGPELQAKYGKQKTYTPQQVKTTMRARGYSTGDDCYGMAMYCDRAEFDDYHRSIGEVCNYTMMRGEVSQCLFDSEVEFNTDTIFDIDFGASLDDASNNSLDFSSNDSSDYSSSDSSSGGDYSSYDSSSSSYDSGSSSSDSGDSGSSGGD